MLDKTDPTNLKQDCAYSNLKGKRILVIEDDPILAVDYHFQLKGIGAKGEGFKASNREALSYLDTHEIDAAIVDFNLCDGTGESIIAALKRRDIPFIVVSGCTFRMHGEVDEAHVLSKPVEPEEICRALSAALY